MARGINKFIGVGNLGQDPESRFTPSGTQVCNFSVALSESWTDKSTGEIKERTEWITCESWGRLAEVCAEYLRKGSKVYVEGRLQTDKWEKDGETKYRTKIRIDNMLMLDGKPQDGSRTSATPQQRPAPQQDFDDDIPF